MDNELSLADLLRKCAAMMQGTTMRGLTSSLSPKLPAPKLAVNPNKPLATLTPAMPGKTAPNPISTRVPTGNQLPGMNSKGMPKEMIS
jgi:hypothetical protein